MKSYRIPFLILISIPWVCPHLLWASPIKVLTGQITDENGRPLPYVELYLPDPELGTTSDRDGRFRLAYDARKGTRLQILHSAYRTVTIDLDTLKASYVELGLVPRTYHFDPITVEGNLYGKGSLNLPVPHRVLPLSRASSWGNSVGERVDRSGIQIKDYGGPAGLKTVASPTGYGEHILVMLDGLPLNSPQHGGFDFSTLPADILDHGEYYPGHGSSLYGSNAVGGTLNFLPYARRSLSVTLKSGSFGEKGIGGWLPLSLGNVKAYLYGSGFESTGDFQYSGPNGPQIRENNDFSQTLFTLGASRPFGRQWKGSYFGLGSRASRGVTGLLQFPSLSARKVNDDRIHLVTLRGISGLGKSEIHLGLVDTYEQYTDPDWQVESKHNVSSGILRLVHRFPEGSVFQNSVILEARRQSVDSRDTGTHRTALGALGGLSQVRLSPDVQASLTLREEYGSDQGSPITTGSLGLLWKPRLGGLRSVIANLGTSYRTPTFNDRFWQDPSGFSMGSPELKPERGRSAHVGIEGDLPSFPSVIFRAAAYHFLTWNLIQWTPDENFVFSPENLSASESYGLTLTTRVDPRTFPVRLRVTTNWNVSQVLTEGPDQYDELLYVPRLSHWIELEYSAGAIDFSTTYRTFGKRRYSYFDDPSGNPPFLEPYHRLDASLSFEGFRIKNVGTRLVIGARNLEDRRGQESVFGYPEPGRALFARLVFRVD
ncbi:MAG: TonB-dependent receptor plug domain-containing protein [Fidelibacterota bacterium]